MDEGKVPTCVGVAGVLEGGETALECTEVEVGFEAGGVSVADCSGVELGGVVALWVAVVGFPDAGGAEGADGLGESMQVFGLTVMERLEMRLR